MIQRVEVLGINSYRWILQYFYLVILMIDPYRNDDLLGDGRQSMKVEISVSCRNLLVDYTYVRLTIKLSEPGKPLRTILQTKPKINERNIDYDETLPLNYIFQIKQTLIFELQCTNKTQVIKSSATVGEIFGQREKRIIKPLLNPHSQECGKIIVRCEAVASNNKFVTMSIQGLNLPDFTVFYFFGGTYPYFRLVKKRKGENFLVYESQVIPLSRNPNFKTFTISMGKLCDNDQEMPIILQLLSFSDGGRHSVIGGIQFTLSSLRRQNNFEVYKNQKPVRNCKILFNTFDIVQRYSFTDFIMGGMEIQLITCIDFTGSNGIANRPQSLHYIGGNKMTAYELALKAVGDILLDYDTDKQVPTFGFGAKVKLPNFNTQGKVHQAFPLNGDMESPDVYHVGGMLQVYRQCIPYLEFAGPTVFAPLLKQNMRKARQLKANGNQYMILLILTDGDIMDEVEVCDLLIECSRLPLSIVIVGIGDGDFDIMERIDDDEMRMTSSTGVKTERDLVQFVPFRNFLNNGVELAKEVLAELPRQVVEYHALCRLAPQPQCSEGKKNKDENRFFVQE